MNETSKINNKKEIERKYELVPLNVDHNGKWLYRIRALKDFADVKKGDFGGYVETEDNLDQFGDCWIYDEGKVTDTAWVGNNARVYDFGTVEDNARVLDDAVVREYASVIEDAEISGTVELCGTVSVEGYSRITGGCTICGKLRFSRNVYIDGYGTLKGDDKDLCVSSSIF